MLRRLDDQLEVELLPLATSGDRLSSVWERQERARPGQGVGPAALEADPERQAQVGAFVKELEQAILEGRADMAVHSLKDVPTRLPPGLVLGAYPVREDPRDVAVFPLGAPWGARPARLGTAGPAGAAVRPAAAAREIGRAERALAWLPDGARVGTSSLRRLLQIRAVRPDAVGVTVRGNVETRLAKLDGGHADVLVLAGAGLLRMGLEGRVGVWLDARDVVPAPGQGALAVECRADDPWLLECLRGLDDARVRVQVAAERGFLEAVEAGCRWPVGALADGGEAPGAALQLVGFVALPVGACERPHDPGRPASPHAAGFGGEGGPAVNPDPAGKRAMAGPAGETAMAEGVRVSGARRPDGLRVRDACRGEVDGWVWGRATLEASWPASEIEARRLGGSLARWLLGRLASDREGMRLGAPEPGA